MIACLPWYDLPPVENEIDRFYFTLRETLLSQLTLAGVSSTPVQIPEQRDRQARPEEQWANPQLLLSQCCGGDLFTNDGGQLVPLARPVFKELDCESGNYYSYIVAHNSLNNTPRIAINSSSSYSGCISLFNWLKREGMQSRKVTVSGSHQASLALLQRGEVDVIAVDANTWQLLDLGGKDIIDKTDEAPAPPFVCHRETAHLAHYTLDALKQTLRSTNGVAGISSLLDCCAQDYDMMALEMNASTSSPSSRFA